MSLARPTLPPRIDAGIRGSVRLLPLIAILLTGCSSTKPMKLPWNTRAEEQARMNDATSEKQQNFEQRVMSQDPSKAFNLDSANAGGSRRYETREASTGEFQFVDHVRTKDYDAGKYETKAWQGESVYETKTADTKESRYANKDANSKTYDTKDSRYAGKSAEVRALPDGERAFLNKGRRQADFDTHGPAASAPNQSWEGNLQKMTVEDVRKLLNKN